VREYRVVLDLNEIEHTEAYNTAGNPEVLKILDKVLDGTPKVQISDVISSTIHKPATMAA
jgi:hypothetical protein